MRGGGGSISGSDRLWHVTDTPLHAALSPDASHRRHCCLLPTAVFDRRPRLVAYRPPPTHPHSRQCIGYSPVQLTPVLSTPILCATKRDLIININGPNRCSKFQDNVPWVRTSHLLQLDAEAVGVELLERRSPKVISRLLLVKKLQNSRCEKNRILNFRLIGDIFWCQEILIPDFNARVSLLFNSFWKLCLWNGAFQSRFSFSTLYTKSFYYVIENFLYTLHMTDNFVRVL